jgi:aminoglycoside phosphotransferase (APT) family kinase protein
VTRWLDRVLPGERVLGAIPLTGGYSNSNTRLVTAAGRSYVLRRYLRAQDGPARELAEAERRCAVEAALAERLRGVAPVAEVVAADTRGAEAGEPVLLSRFDPGVMLRAALAEPGASEDDHAALGREAGRALAAIGRVGFDRAGFFGDGTLTPAAEGRPASLAEFVDDCLARGHAHEALDPAEIAGLRSLAAAWTPLAARADGDSRLVHSDYNPKNLLVARDGRNTHGGRDTSGGWSVTAVLDWEFAFSGSPLHDVGNMLRFTGEIPPAFAAAFTGGFRAAGGRLPADWREISRALDLYALAELLTRPVSHRYFGKAVAAIRARLTGQ